MFPIAIPVSMFPIDHQVSAYQRNTRISWKATPNSSRILIIAWWIKFVKFYVITITPTRLNRHAVPGQRDISGFMEVKPILGNFIKTMSNGSWVVWWQRGKCRRQIKHVEINMLPDTCFHVFHVFHVSHGTNNKRALVTYWFVEIHEGHSCSPSPRRTLGWFVSCLKVKPISVRCMRYL